MQRDGFTIVEVMIFLAISGLLLTMAMAGSSNLARQARYSDAVNSFHSLVQRQYEEVATGVNTRQSGDPGCLPGPSPTPGADSCLLLGKVITFTDINGTGGFVRYVRSTVDVPVNSTASILDQIVAANVAVSDIGSETFELQWGAQFQVASRTSGVMAGDVVRAGSTRARINNIAFIKGPNTSEIIPYYFYSNATTAATVQTRLRLAATNHALASGTNTNADVCIYFPAEWGTASRAAAIKLTNVRSAAGIDVKFDPTRPPSTPATNSECL